MVSDDHLHVVIKRALSKLPQYEVPLVPWSLADCSPPAPESPGMKDERLHSQFLVVAVAVVQVLYISRCNSALTRVEKPWSVSLVAPNGGSILFE